MVVIPVFREKPDNFEKISLNRFFKVFKAYPIVFVTPIGLDLSDYKSKNSSIHIIQETFPNHYFNSVGGYNHLLCSQKFYKRFIKYEYILIAQLDSYVFSDELISWCNKGYDYVGAPWLNNSIQRKFYESTKISRFFFLRAFKKYFDFNKGNFLNVGNGGFSLRKVKSFIKYSRWLKLIEPNLTKYQPNEDMIWSILVPKYFKQFRIAPFEDALKFSFDSDPEKAFIMNNRNMPFGCHGWSKSENISFWFPLYINEVN